MPITILILALGVACLSYLWSRREGLNKRDLVAQLLVTLVGTYLGFLGSLEASREIEDERVFRLVMAQANLAMQPLNSSKFGIENKEPDEYVDRLIDMAVPAMKRLAGTEGAARVLGHKTIYNLDSTIYFAERYATDKVRRPALSSHLSDMWRALAYGMAAAINDKSLAHCQMPEKFRTCDVEVHAFVDRVLPKPKPVQ